MVFDIRGRRKHVVRAVYAILAVLMGASLFLVTGGVSLSGLFNSGGGGGGGAKVFEEQAARIERKLAKSPEDPTLLASLIRAQISTGNAQKGFTSSGEEALTPDTVQAWEKASDTWSKYLKATDEPAASTAQRMSETLFALANVARSYSEAENNIVAATEAQKIVADKRPNPNSVSTLALYTMYTFDYPTAEKLGKRAGKLTSTKFERENLENQLEETRKNAEKFQKLLVASNKATKGAGKEAIENPLGGLGGPTLSE